MRDFTLMAYSNYLCALKNNGVQFLRFDEFMKLDNKPEAFCLIRHDVDRKPLRALKMAKLEKELGVKSTYYFRTKRHTFKSDIIHSIAALGHEIGYHYESLSDARGDLNKALNNFRLNLAALRKITAISTCSMHGRPLQSFDNRDLWKIQENHEVLTTELGLLGEVYLDIDYKDIAYVNDTGRNWTSGLANKRDKVNSNVPADFDSGSALLKTLKNGVHSKLIFQVHPERWTDNALGWLMQLIKDRLINVAKKIVR